MCYHLPSAVRSHNFYFPIWLGILLFLPSASLLIQSIMYWVLCACTDLGAWDLSVNNAKQDSCPLHSNGEDTDNRHHKHVNNSILEGGKWSRRSKKYSRGNQHYLTGVEAKRGTSLAIQVLRLCAPNARGPGSIPRRGTKILNHGHSQFFLKSTKNNWRSLSPTSHIHIPLQSIPITKLLYPQYYSMPCITFEKGILFPTFTSLGLHFLPSQLGMTTLH